MITPKEKNHITIKLRLIWRYYDKERKAALAEARQEDKYRCAMCKNLFRFNEIAVDHIDPVVDPIAGFTSWDNYISRLFCVQGNLAVLCHFDHAIKTKREDLIRRQHGTGRYSTEVRQRMSLIHKGHSYNKGIPKSISHRLSMSLERKGKPQTQARIIACRTRANKQRVPIVATCVSNNTSQLFDSINSCATSLSLIPSDVSRTLRGDQNRRQHKGWIFDYVKKAA